MQPWAYPLYPLHYGIPMLERIRIVLVNTYHPGNIGSAARAMKVMGLTRLYLVTPVQFPHVDANTMAAGAEDILDNVVICQTLEEAIGDCEHIIATSARPRTRQALAMTPPECATFVQGTSRGEETAVVFGRERSGLTTEEYELCNKHVFIPANPDYSILNMASAVQIIAYELYQKSLNSFEPVKKETAFPTAKEMKFFLERMEERLESAGYFKGKPKEATLAKLRAYFQRNLPEKAELSLLQGILTRVESKEKTEPNDNNFI